MSYGFYFLYEYNSETTTVCNMVRFQVLTVTSMKMAVFWEAVPYSLADIE
jgi:hypothetical protein